MKAIKTTPGFWLVGFDRAIGIKGIAIAVAICVCMVGALGIGATAGAAQTNGSELTIRGTNGDYHGRLESKTRFCEENRTVVVYKVAGSTPAPSQDRRIGSDTTDNRGEWEIGNSGYAHGRFYARARREVLRATNRASTDCAGARSEVIKR